MTYVAAYGFVLAPTAPTEPCATFITSSAFVFARSPSETAGTRADSMRDSGGCAVMFNFTALRLSPFDAEQKLRQGTRM
jgi:hypothetical protein